MYCNIDSNITVLHVYKRKGWGEGVGWIGESVIPETSKLISCKIF